MEILTASMISLMTFTVVLVAGAPLLAPVVAVAGYAIARQ